MKARQLTSWHQGDGTDKPERRISMQMDARAEAGSYGAGIKAVEQQHIGQEERWLTQDFLQIVPREAKQIDFDQVPGFWVWRLF